MRESIQLEPEDREHFVRIVESSLGISKRHHFFSWTQGVVQALLPHEILVCAMDHGAGAEIAIDLFSGCHDFREEHLKEIYSPRHSLLRRMMSHWQEHGQPYLCAGEMKEVAGTRDLGNQIASSKLRNIVAHGTLGPGGAIKSFFGFSRVNAAFGPHLAHRLEILMPHLHCTFARVMAEESAQITKSPAAITHREAEILEWVREGKTNQEIALILQLSPLTVKNHARNIFKKLDVSTRGQAVARAINLRLIRN
jgi:transcriptional regulator EpsA